MRSLIMATVIFLLQCGGKSHEIAVPVPSSNVPSGQASIQNATGVPCGIRLQFEFVDQRLVRIIVLNDNTIPAKVTLRNQRTGVNVVICTDSNSTGDKSSGGAGSFGQMGDRFTGDVSLQSVPGAHFFCLDGRTDGFDVCSGLTVTLTPEPR